MIKTILISIAIVISQGLAYQYQDDSLTAKIHEKMEELVKETTEYGSLILSDQVTFDQVKDIVDQVMNELDNISQDEGWKYGEDMSVTGYLEWKGRKVLS
jgi:hypothetical protein